MGIYVQKNDGWSYLRYTAHQWRYNMDVTDMLLNSDKAELESMSESLSTISTSLLIFAAIMTVVMVIWWIRRQKRIKEAAPKKVHIQRTAFSSTHFGVVYEGDEENEYRQYAIICNGKGEELCRYEEADGQTICGFSVEEGNLYMHTIETYDDMEQAPVRWMFVPEHNELVECD